MSQMHEFDPNEVTEHGQTNGRVRQLTDPDAYVMLGKLASAVARCEASMQEASRLWSEDRAEAKKDREEARIARRKLQRSTRVAGASTVGLVGVAQAVIYILQHAGVLK